MTTGVFDPIPGFSTGRALPTSLLRTPQPRPPLCLRLTSPTRSHAPQHDATEARSHQAAPPPRPLRRAAAPPRLVQRLLSTASPSPSPTSHRRRRLQCFPRRTSRSTSTPTQPATRRRHPSVSLSSFCCPPLRCRRCPGAVVSIYNEKTPADTSGIEIHEGTCTPVSFLNL
jgi:hypothetical protein